MSLGITSTYLRNPSETYLDYLSLVFLKNIRQLFFYKSSCSNISWKRFRSLSRNSFRNNSKEDLQKSHQEEFIFNLCVPELFLQPSFRVLFGSNFHNFHQISINFFGTTPQHYSSFVTCTGNLSRTVGSGFIRMVRVVCPNFI